MAEGDQDRAIVVLLKRWVRVVLAVAGVALVGAATWSVVDDGTDGVGIIGLLVLGGLCVGLSLAGLLPTTISYGQLRVVIEQRLHKADQAEAKGEFAEAERLRSEPIVIGNVSIAPEFFARQAAVERLAHAEAELDRHRQNLVNAEAYHQRTLDMGNAITPNAQLWLDKAQVVLVIAERERDEAQRALDEIGHRSG
jgi:hypothetical protein